MARPAACRATAHSNIALCKYWGKRDATHNVPDVPSLSLTLAALSTTTRVSFDADLREDEFRLGGEPADTAARARVCSLLDRVRDAAGIRLRARVESANDFPTASGLASSASGFAALAVASLGAAGLSWPPGAVSELARASSVSAARSIFGGFVAMEAGALAAEPIDAAEVARRVVMVIAVTERGPKAVGSTRGMLLTQATSPYYSAFHDVAPRLYRELRAALHAGDLEQVGEIMEHSTALMHAAMLAAKPALVYWNPATLAAIHCVRALRQEGVFAFFTIDAGPHVKVLTSPTESARVARELAAVPGVREIMVSGVGGGARVLEPS